MTGWLKKSFTQLLLVLLFSSLVFLIPALGLTQETEAEPRGLYMGTSRLGQLARVSNEGPGVPICEPTQTQNLVPNRGFEQGIGWPNHWYEGGDECAFTTCEPGHAGSSSSGCITAASVRDDRCLLFSPMDEIRVEGGRFYDYSAWIKTSALEGEAYLRVTFWSHQGDPPVWNWEGEGLTNSVTDTQGEWDRVTGSAQAPADAEYARIEATLPKLSVGTVCFDDIFLGLGTCLDISKCDEPPSVMPGKMLAYTIAYTNTGREKATNVRIIETYDGNVVFVKAQPDPDMSTNIWEPPDPLDSGASGKINVWVDVRHDAPSWLLNEVEILSDETVGSISDDELTRVYTETLDMAIKPIKQSRSGEPGRLTEYDLTLWNTGAFDGEVELGSCSSLCSPPIITPPSPYPLPSGISKTVTVGLVMPYGVSCGDRDVTRITATLSCAEPGVDPKIVTATLTTVVPSPIFLPMVAKNFDPNPCFKGWEAEPNNYYDQANGQLCSGERISGYPNDDWDIFSIDLRDKGQIVVHLTIESGEGVQLQLRDQEHMFLNYAYRKPYHLEYTGSAGLYYVCVYTESGHRSDDPYNLWATFPY